MRRIIILLALLFLILSSNAQEITTNDIFTKLIYNTDHCIDNCYAVYEFCNPNFPPNPIPIASIKHTFSGYIKKENPLLIEKTIKEEYNCITGTHLEEKCTTHTDNITQEEVTTCEDVIINDYGTCEREVNKFVVPNPNEKIPAGECRNIKISGSIGLNNAVEWIPEITINGKKFKQNKWAWWSSYFYRRNITNTSTNMLIPINQSWSDIDGDGTKEMIYGRSEFVYYNSSNIVAIANDTTEFYKVQTHPIVDVSGTPPDSLDIFMPFDNEDTNVWDFSGNNNNGTLYGGVTQGVSSSIGKAYYFDGNDDYISIPYIYGHQGTIIMYVNPKDAGGGAIELLFGGMTSEGLQFENYNNGHSYWGFVGTSSGNIRLDLTGGAEKFPSGDFFIMFRWDDVKGNLSLWWDLTEKGKSENLPTLSFTPVNMLVMAWNVSGSANDKTQGNLSWLYILNYSIGDVEYEKFYNATHSVYLSVEESLTIPTYNTSLYAVSFNISDFSFSSSSYVEVDKIQFNTSQTKNLTFLSSFNIEKLTGAGTNKIRVNLTVDGEQILEERVRTVQKFDEGAVGTLPVAFSVDAGTHNLTIWIRRETGNGAIEVNDINAILIEMLSTQGYNVTDDLATVDTSFSNTELAEIQKIQITKTTNSSGFLNSKFNINADASTTVACRYQCLESGDYSPYVVRHLSDSSDSGNLFLAYVDPDSSTSHNISLQCHSTTGATVTITGSVFIASLKDQNNNTIQNFESSNISTNYSSTLTLTAGKHKIANGSIYLQNGTGIFISGFASIGSNTGSQTPTLFINVSGVPESQCYVKKERYLSGSSDIGNLDTFYICEGLTTGHNYSVNLYINVPTGEAVILYDEGIAGFEVSEFDISIYDTAPIIAINEPINNQVMDQDGEINWTITDIQGDRYTTNITLWNSTNTTNIAIDLPDTITNYTFNFSSLPDGTYNLTLRTCENESTDLLCSSETVQVIISTNLAPYSTLNSPDDNGTEISIPPTLNVTVTDPNADVVNVTFYNSSDDSILCFNISIPSGSDVYCLWDDLSTNTTYAWYVIVTDGVYPTTSDTWNFTTIATTTTTTTLPATTTTTIRPDLLGGIMRIIYDDLTLANHKLAVYQLSNYTNSSGGEAWRYIYLTSFSQRRTYDSYNEKLGEDITYLIKVQDQKEDFISSPEKLQNTLFHNLGYMVGILILISLGIITYKKIK